MTHFAFWWEIYLNFYFTIHQPLKSCTLSSSSLAFLLFSFHTNTRSDTRFLAKPVHAPMRYFNNNEGKNINNLVKMYITRHDIWQIYAWWRWLERTFIGASGKWKCICWKNCDSEDIYRQYLPQSGSARIVMVSFWLFYKHTQQQV